MFYDANLNITILNNWNIGPGSWSATGAAGSAQALAEAAGSAATGLSGWVLPTGDGNQAAGAGNQFLSIWNDVGASVAGLEAQFDGVQTGLPYWSGTELSSILAWDFLEAQTATLKPALDKTTPLFAVAVRSGDVTASVPEPQTLALALVALCAMGVVRRMRPR